MTENIMDAFSQSLSDRPKEMLSQLDYSKLLIDNFGMDVTSILEDSTLNNIPVLNYILSAADTAQKISSHNLLHQTAVFFQEYYAGGELSEKAKRHLEKILSNPETAQNEIGRVLILLNRNLDGIKSQYDARYLLEYLNNRISCDEFFELLDITDRMFSSDFKLLNTIYCSEGVTWDDLSYRHDRLISFGLLQSQYDHRPAMLGGSIEDVLLRITPIGERMCNIIFRNE